MTLRIMCLNPDPQALGFKKTRAHPHTHNISSPKGKAIKSSQISHRKLLVTPGRFHWQLALNHWTQSLKAGINARRLHLPCALRKGSCQRRNLQEFSDQGCRLLGLRHVKSILRSLKHKHQSVLCVRYICHCLKMMRNTMVNMSTVQNQPPRVACVQTDYCVV